MESNSNSVRKKNAKANKPFKPFQTPQPSSRALSHQDSLFNDSLRQSLAKSADRYIPSRSAAHSDFIRAVFDRKIKNAKSQFTAPGKADQSPKKTSLSPDLKKESGEGSEAERSLSLENTSLSEKTAENASNEASFASARGVGNEDSFNASFFGATKGGPKTGSPCGESSKSASKRARSQLNSDAFLGVKGADVWDQRILKFKQSINSIESVKPKEERPLSEREKMDKRSSSIAKNAEKVLDAPDILKSSALNLLSWVFAENSDVLAVALANEVYFWFVAKNEIKQLSSLVREANDNNNPSAEELPLIGSVLWFGSGFFAVGTSDATISIYAFQNHFKSDARPVTRTHKIDLSAAVAGVARSGAAERKRQNSMVTALSWGRRRKLLFAAQRDGAVSVHRFLGGRAALVATLGGPKAQVCRFCWSPLGDALVAGSRDGRAFVFSERLLARAAAPIAPLAALVPAEAHPAAAASVKAAEWCPWESHLVALGRSDGSVALYDLAQCLSLRKTAGGVDSHSAAFGAQSESAFGADNEPFPLISAPPGAKNELFSVFPLRSVRGGRRAVTGLAFLPEHRELLTAHAEGGLQLWSYPELTVLAELRGHTRAVLGLALSAGRGLAASAGCDETVRIWRVAEERKRRSAAAAAVR